MEPLREIHGFKKRDEDQLNGKVLDLSAKTVFSIIAAYTEENSPFWAIEKGAVLQEARCFNDTQLSSRKCQQVIYIYVARFIASITASSVGDYKAVISV
jgi:hypothetical protein